MTDPLPDLVLYSRPGCHLCDDARASIATVLAERRGAGLAVPALTERNIDADEELHRRYAFTIPVVAIGGREVELATGAAKIRRLLTDVLDGAGEAAR